MQATALALCFRRLAEGTRPMLRDDINNALKEAMKSKDERRVSTLRLMNSTL
jgi:hypothetical protein